MKASIAFIVLLSILVSSCGTGALHFEKNFGYWEAVTKVTDSPFRTNTIAFQIHTAGGVFLEPPTQDQFALAKRVRKSLPRLLPLIAQRLQAYSDDLKAKDALTEKLFNPTVCIDSDDPKPQSIWSFTVDCPDTPGDPSVGDGLVYIVKFNEMEIIDVYAGD